MREIREKRASGKKMRCGVVALVGRPNVGKSSLVNALLKEKVAVVSPKPQTTRNAVRCIYNDDRAQIVFTDTPGVHIPKDKLGKFLSDSVKDTLDDADAVCWLVEANDRKIGAEDREVLGVLAEVRCPVVLVVNKCDRLKPDSRRNLERVEALYRAALPFAERVALSAKSGQGVAGLIDLLAPLLPEAEPWYDPDVLMDGTERFMASEIVRGQVLSLLRDEVPHCVAVEIEEYKSPDEYPDRDKLYVRASLIVETEGQKAILIGASGAMLKKIGQAARIDLEKATGHSAYLELWVKVSPRWRQSDLILRRLGYSRPGRPLGA
ncbi:MAG: GTPase Era [Synergistaceae bacterium]|jgi:GTP-binding protein Era|nr:GTPase Era [Synergistaceae bacterium]